MQENMSETNLSSLFIYFGIRFIYTQRNNIFPGNSSFSWNRKLNLPSENDSIWAANLTLNIAPDLDLYKPSRWHLPGIGMSGCDLRACRASSPEPSRWAGRSHVWAGQVKNCPLTQLPMVFTKEQIPQDLVRVTNAPGEAGVNWTDHQNQQISPAGASRDSRDHYGEERLR